MSRLSELERKVRDQAIMASLSLLHREVQAMAKTVDEILAQQAEVMTKVQANTDATAAVAATIESLKAEIVALNEQLVAAGTDPAKLQQVSDNLTTIAESIDADTLAEQALANTGAT